MFRLYRSHRVASQGPQALTQDKAPGTYIEQAITDIWGERCDPIDDDCPTCQAWAEFDALSQAYERGQVDMRERAARHLEAVADTYLPGGPMDAKGGLRLGSAAIRSLPIDGKDA